MDQRCDSGGAKKGGAAFLVPQALRLEQRAEPTPWAVPSACQDCPYPGHGFLCRSRDGRCLRDRVRLLRQRETARDTVKKCWISRRSAEETPPRLIPWRRWKPFRGYDMTLN